MGRAKKGDPQGGSMPTGVGRHGRIARFANRPEGPAWTWPTRVLRRLTALTPAGLREALASAETQRASCGLPKPFGSREAMLGYVRPWRGAAARYDDGGFDPDLGAWREEVALPVAPFLSLMSREPGDRDDGAPWRRWFAEECADAVADGRRGYAELLFETIEEEVVVVELPGGRVDVWDGWHRLAATVAKGRTTVRAVVGRAPAEAAVGTA